MGTELLFAFGEYVTWSGKSSLFNEIIFQVETNF
jgi:hypothetical protein